MLVPGRPQRRIDPDATAIVADKIDLVFALGALGPKAGALLASVIAGVVVNFRARGAAASAAKVQWYAASVYVTELDLTAAATAGWHRLACAGRQSIQHNISLLSTCCCAMLRLLPHNADDGDPMPFSVNLGPCSACQKNPAVYRLGARACTNERCGKTFDQICAKCADKPCPECRKGKLEQIGNVFPHSLFRAIAAEQEDEVIRLLTGRSIDLNDLTDSEGETPLSRAARCKTAAVAVSLCEKLIELGASPQARTKENGRTALIMMVLRRSNEVPFCGKVASLLADSINVQDDSGATALMYVAEGAGAFASRRGNISVAEDFVALGADLLIEDGRGHTALGYAVASNDKGTNEPMIDYLKEQMIARVALHEFKRRYKYDFDKQGRLNFSSKRR
jgi:hypothetical protein